MQEGSRSGCSVASVEVTGPGPGTCGLRSAEVPDPIDTGTRGGASLGGAVLPDRHRRLTARRTTSRTAGPRVAGAVNHEGVRMLTQQSLSRRNFVKLGGVGAASLLLGSNAPFARANGRPPKFDADPFSLGVASGDPLPDGTVLWTRLAPAPLTPTGGMLDGWYDVRDEVAKDEGVRQIADAGTMKARPEAAHSVHVELRNLEPSRWYWYRFKVGDHLSPVGRTRTAPPRGRSLDRLRFAFASCQN